MNVIVGATGQVGSNVIGTISEKGFPVRAVVRNPGKGSQKGIEIRTADLFDAEQLTQAFEGAVNLFVMTPENPAARDIIADTSQIVENYRRAIVATGIKKVVALSCIGAHLEGKTGNILMSRMLEHGLDDLAVEKVFIRPSYYFSNWLNYRDVITAHGLLPTFFPEELQVEMNSPVDLAHFIAEVMMDTSGYENKRIFEVAGPQKYSSMDVAAVFSSRLHKNVLVQSIPKENWKETLMTIGFTENTADNLSDMTQAVIDNKTVPERPGDLIRLPTTLEKYMEAYIKR